MKAVNIFGQTYKVAIHCEEQRVFKQNDEEWLLTKNFSVYEVQQAIKDQEAKRRKAEAKKRLAEQKKEQARQQKLQEILHGQNQ